MAEEKILAEEKLEEEQLDQVVGGTMWEIEDDIKRFKELGVLSKGVDKRDKDAIERAFRVYGINAVPHGDTPFVQDNEYSIGGRKMNREEAWRTVYIKAGNYRPQVK